MEIPYDVYNQYRLDFEQNVRVHGIYAGNETVTEYEYAPNAVRVIFFALEAMALVALVIFCCRRRKKKTEDFGSGKHLARGAAAEEPQGSDRRKPWMMILVCNFFLCMTVALFQPLTELLVNLPEFPFESVWLGQLLLALGGTAVLSGLMILLPARGGRIAAAVSFGGGIAYLVQNFLLNAEKPLRMDTNWPMEMLNIFTWFGIVIIAAAMAAYYTGEQGQETEKEKKTGKILGKIVCVTACLLVILQAMNFTVLGTAESRDETYMDRYSYLIAEQEQEKDPDAPEKQAGAGDVMSVSMYKGMPFFLKGPDYRE